MDGAEIISIIKKRLPDFNAISVVQDYPDEICIKVKPEVFKETCLTLHKMLLSPVMMLFALDERKTREVFAVNAVFINLKPGQWIMVSMDILPEDCSFDSLAKNIHSAALFERQIAEMFGILPQGNPDLRRLNLHDEVWPQGAFPLRKDFSKMAPGNLNEYKFERVEGTGIFEVPVGPVHAGIIGPGHFRFSLAGEPIVNLEIRLGFTHRGVEKLFEGKSCFDVQGLVECICGDSVFAYSLAFAQAVEKISQAAVPSQAAYLRGIFLELERMYNHANDIGGIALDVGFSFPAAYAALIKEAVLQLNAKLTSSRYLKKVNTAGGVLVDLDENKKQMLLDSIGKIRKDCAALSTMLNSSVSFMDRVDTTGVLIQKTARDLGVVGLAGRACGIAVDLRKCFPGIYGEVKFRMITQEAGDVLSRLKMRFYEFEESCRLIEEFTAKLASNREIKVNPGKKAASSLGYAEGWRGPVLCYLKTDQNGLIERCKFVDASSNNWLGLKYAVLGNIIPDFPVCNKSFDLSYPGNDL
ncbi:MAG TPA: NADH-quinone oxidoreductase subunit C [Candidatus Omnitrophota bacterium]|nr:NADH-quinone oxidoreductase subunit C [Candidatus Omnitrophota bacterium]